MKKNALVQENHEFVINATNFIQWQYYDFSELINSSSSLIFKLLHHHMKLRSSNIKSITLDSSRELSSLQFDGHEPSLRFGQSP